MHKLLTLLVVTSVAAAGVGVGTADKQSAVKEHNAPFVAAVVHTQPSQCTGTYTNTIVVGDRTTTNGTAGNDLIYAGSSNVVNGNGGDDCIVLEGSRNVVDAGDGNDVVVSKVGSDQVAGSTGNDVLVGANRDALDGGAGTDTCSGDRTVSLVNCEQ